MTEPRSPIELLGAILDEVEGLRRTNERSFLPTTLTSEIRLVVEDGAGVAGGKSRLLNKANQLQGRTIAHVFDSELRQGDLVLLCTDGAFLALQAEDGGYGDPPRITELSYGSAEITDYLRPHALLDAGLMTLEQKRKAEIAEEVEKARGQLAKAAQDATQAQAMLDRLEGKRIGEAA